MDDVDLSCEFLGKIISFPFLISCMTGGSKNAISINEQLAEVAAELNIPIGVGSQRQALENKDYHESYKIIRNKAGRIPILGNIGAAQVAELENSDSIKFLIDIIEADALYVHINPLQEVIQRGGEPRFKGVLKKIEMLCSEVAVPVFVKEVGAGISKRTAKTLLDVGIKGIDVAGAGGTSWAAVELLRNGEPDQNYYWDWGLPTSYCVKEIAALKNDYDFVLISSGGVDNFDAIAKSLVLGADITGAARKVLTALSQNGADGVNKLIIDWFENVKKIMFLTGCKNISELKKVKLIKKEELF